jgi:myo-inositol 2-dehydrogenase/D-chiro-inositol 1-dehydrogenase
MVAQTLRFDATVLALRRQLEALGDLHLIAIDHRFEPTGRAWLDSPDEGGLLSNTGIHGVDLLRFLTGLEIVEARALARSVVLHNVPDVFAAVLRLEPGGVLATLDNSRATGSRTGRIEVVGQQGQLLADHVHRTLVRVEGRSATPLDVGPEVPTVREALRAFVDAIVNDRPVPISLEDGLAAVEAVDLIRASIQERQP